MAGVAHAAPRRLDHLVLPVSTLADARAFFDALGFVVAPEAAHPFGTANACVFFADGTYLEPLAIADAGLCAREARAGNVFVARDRAFRDGQGVPGFSGIAFVSDSAEADHAAFAAAGIAEGEIYQFSRVFDAAGGRRTLTFRLAFAGLPSVPGLFLFGCQALVAKGDRSALTGHANGVTGIKRLVLAASNPAASAGFLGSATGAVPTVSGGGLALDLGHGAIEVLDAAGLKARYGRRVGADGLRMAGVVLGVRDIEAVRERANGAGIATTVAEGRLLVDFLGSAQAFFAFEQA